MLRIVFVAALWVVFVGCSSNTVEIPTNPKPKPDNPPVTEGMPDAMDKR